MAGNLNQRNVDSDGGPSPSAHWSRNGAELPESTPCEPERSPSSSNEGASPVHNPAKEHTKPPREMHNPGISPTARFTREHFWQSGPSPQPPRFTRGVFWQRRTPAPLSRAKRRRKRGQGTLFSGDDWHVPSEASAARRFRFPLKRALKTGNPNRRERSEPFEPQWCVPVVPVKERPHMQTDPVRNQGRHEKGGRDPR